MSRDLLRGTSDPGGRCGTGLADRWAIRSIARHKATRNNDRVTVAFPLPSCPTPPIGVRKFPPRPPNRACGSPAHGSPIAGFLLGSISRPHGLFAGRTTLDPRRRRWSTACDSIRLNHLPLTPLPGADTMRSVQIGLSARHRPRGSPCQATTFDSWSCDHAGHGLAPCGQRVLTDALVAGAGPSIHTVGDPRKGRGCRHNDVAGPGESISTRVGINGRRGSIESLTPVARLSHSRAPVLTVKRQDAKAPSLRLLPRRVMPYLIRTILQ
jgi:hypothetical protein